MISIRIRSLILAVCGGPLSIACSGDSGTRSSPDAGTPPPGATPADGATIATGDSQTPPMGAQLLEAWLAQGAYKQWHCEAAVHASRSPSVHNFNRICSNDAIFGSATGTGDFPAGAAAVKELYESASGAAPVGYAVYLKTKADSAGGANWYWYERVPLTGSQSGAPHDMATGVVADGLGASGTPLTICVGCHGAAGSDAAHTPSPGGRDQVYTPVH